MDGERRWKLVLEGDKFTSLIFSVKDIPVLRTYREEKPVYFYFIVKAVQKK